MSQPVTFGLIYDFHNPEPWQQPWADRYQAVLDQIAWVDSDLRHPSEKKASQLGGRSELRGAETA
jgi:hypothetical protein